MLGNAEGELQAIADPGSTLLNPRRYTPRMAHSPDRCRPCRMFDQSHSIYDKSERLYVLRLPGQMMGSKNSVKTTKAGRRYPNPLFVDWRGWCIQANAGPASPHPGPVVLEIMYWRGDNRTRDKDNLEGGLFHLLVKGGWVTDDNTEVITNTHWHYMGLDRKNARAEVEIWTA